MKTKIFSILIFAAIMFTISPFSCSIVLTTAFADDTITAEIENISVPTDEESENPDLYSELSNMDHMAICDATEEYIETLDTPGVGSTGGEWMVICLTRRGRECPDGYYENVVDYVNENINESEQLHRAKSTDNSRVILALTSAGYDVTDVDGHNLLKGLSNMNYIKRQGINGPIWALIALDSYAYEIPKNETEETQVTREAIISYILEKQLPDGGWSIFGEVADPDMTGMAIQALAPYYHTNPNVTASVENALNCLSDIQHENGGFGSIDGICSESCAQVIVALTALGIDPEEDERFLKNGISVADALCMFAVEGGGFEHVPGSGLDAMATEQGQYALVSYFRLLEGKTSLYDMTDVTIFSEEDTESEEDTAVEEDVPLEEEVPLEEDIVVEEELDFSDIDDALYEDYEVTDNSVSAESNTKSEDTIKEKEEKENTQKNIFNENTFTDINKNDWYYDAVRYVYENNLIKGTDIGFEPESKMTRAMLVTVLYRMENDVNTVAVNRFSDVSGGKWYTEAVIWAAENNIVSGVGKNEFAPYEDITREQLAVIIYRYAKMRGIDTSYVSNLETFTDANNISDWALDAIKWANSLSLVNGTSENTLSPKDTATRAQVSTILMRFCEYASK